MGVAHLALDLGLGHQGGHGVDGHDVERARAHEEVGDLEPLLPVVWLRHQELIGVHADAARVCGVKGMLGIDEGRQATAPLGLRHDVVEQGGLARRLRPEDLHDAASGKPPDAECDVERQGARGHEVDIGQGHVAHAHDRALPELLLDLRDR